MIKNNVYALILYPAVIYDDIIEALKIKHNIYDNCYSNSIRFRISKSRILILLETVKYVES